MNKLFSALLTLLLPAALFAQKSDSSAAAHDYAIAVSWQQHSGEYRALSFQAYNFARLSLDQRLAQVQTDTLKCVVVDIDETVLDNAVFQGHEIRKGVSYLPADWTRWTNLAAADTVPGALGFLKYAASRQVETFYVTNRNKADYQATLANLRKFGFPYADEAHLMVNTATSDKEPRRIKLRETHQILLLCGDNLSDFSNVFYREGKDVIREVDRLQAEFGTHFIVLPNPMYGDWEKLLYKDAGHDENERSRQRINGLKTY